MTPVGKANKSVDRQRSRIAQRQACTKRLTSGQKNGERGTPTPFNDVNLLRPLSPMNEETITAGWWVSSIRACQTGNGYVTWYWTPLVAVKE
jgi:hypothetical protein